MRREHSLCPAHLLGSPMTGTLFRMSRDLGGRFLLGLLPRRTSAIFHTWRCLRNRWKGQLDSARGALYNTINGSFFLHVPISLPGWDQGSQRIARELRGCAGSPWCRYDVIPAARSSQSKWSEQHQPNGSQSTLAKLNNSRDGQHWTESIGWLAEEAGVVRD